MSRHQDLPLGKEPSARLVPWIIAFMVYLGCLLAGATFYIIGQAQDWESQLGSSLTIEIPMTQNISERAVQERVFAIVNKMNGVKSAQALPHAEIQKLLAAWIPENANSANLPLPVIIDVALNSHTRIDIKHLEELLKTVSQDVNLVDHRPWVKEVQNVIFIVMLLASLIFGLLLAAIILTSVFATRTSLLIHRQIIEVLHLIGATPTYISRQFDTHTLRYGLLAGFGGSLLATLTFAGLYFVLEGFDVSITLTPSFLQSTLMSLVLVPFLIAGVMLLTARRTVRKALSYGAY